MANSCYFLMKIAGKENNVQEFIRMLQHTDDYGFNRVSSFEPDNDTLSYSPGNAQYCSIEGQGDCDWSLKIALQDYTSKDFLNETKRLGLVVEAYSTEPGCEFQEHIFIDRGELLIEDCVDYEEHFVEDMDAQTLQSLLADKHLTYEELMEQVNSSGEYCVGGFENFGDFQDLFPYLLSMQLQYTDQWGERYTVYPYIEKYQENNNLYMGLLYFDKGAKAVSPFADITINAGKLPYLHGALAPFVVEEKIGDFLTQNGFGAFTGATIQSNFGIYPVFSFHEDKLREISPADFANYARAHGRNPQLRKPGLDSQIQRTDNHQSDLPLKKNLQDPLER